MADIVDKSLTNKLIKGAILLAGKLMEGLMEKMAFKLDYRDWVGFTCEEQIDEEGGSFRWSSWSQGI